ncbi:MAG: IclR family transcriptional regulator [Firmicutes bacterium]|nr:IclR family transcriptional regulator [Bacillota bacterium]
MTIESVDKAIQILNLLAVSGNLRVNEIARRLDLTPSTASRLLSTLADRSYVQRDHRTREYKIGYGAAQLGFAFLGRLELREAARPYLKQLAAQTGETALLSVVNGLNVMCIDKIEGSHTIRNHASWGDMVPLYCGSAGKVLLAFMAPDKLAQLMGLFEFKAFQVNTISSPEKLLQELEKIRRVGYASSIEEFSQGGAGVAAPVFDHQGQAVAALHVGGVASRLVPEALDQLGNLVRKAAKQLSQDLGYVLHHAKKTDSLSIG